MYLKGIETLFETTLFCFMFAELCLESFHDLQIETE